MGLPASGIEPLLKYRLLGCSRDFAEFVLKPFFFSFFRVLDSR